MLVLLVMLAVLVIVVVVYCSVHPYAMIAVDTVIATRTRHCREGQREVQGGGGRTHRAQKIHLINVGNPGMNGDRSSTDDQPQECNGHS